MPSLCSPCTGAGVPICPKGVHSHPVHACIRPRGIESLRARRVLTAMVTPFDEDGAVDFDAFRALARHLVENGSDGVVVTGTTGEAPTLDRLARSSRSARRRSTRSATARPWSRAPARATTAHSVELTEQADALGVDGFLVVTPVLREAAGAGDRRALPGDRGRAATGR